MKVDRTKSKRSSTEVPPDCKVVIDRIKACKTAVELFTVLSAIENWNYGKCELYHWIDVLDIFDSYLEQAAQNVEGSKWAIELDAENNDMLRYCVTYILNFTTLLIEHSFSRNLYNSMDHLVKLLNSVCIRMVLDVLQLLYMFSKRSNFLARLPEDKREGLLERLTYIADSWGGKDAGFGLAACCTDDDIDEYPPSARGVHMEFPNPSCTDGRGKADMMTVIHFDDVSQLGPDPARAMDKIVAQYTVPPEKQIILYTHLRLAFNFPNFEKRCQCVQARLQALSILVYTNALHDNFQQLLYSGLMEEIVDVLRLDTPCLTEIKAAGLRALTSVIHLDRAQNFPSIIDVTGIGSFHGFLPMMVRNCITSMISPPTVGAPPKSYPITLATSLFSFIYHLASYELGGEALVNCGMLESLLKVVGWKPSDEDQITVSVNAGLESLPDGLEYHTFVTRAVRVIDLITNMDMQGFHTHGGLNTFINRLEAEVADCRVVQPFEIIPQPSTSLGRQNTINEDLDIPEEGQEENPIPDGEGGPVNVSDVPMDTESSAQMGESSGPVPDGPPPTSIPFEGNSLHFVPIPQVCLPQRAALLKSLLNFLKKVIQDASFSESIRHIMETSLPYSLRHIISNAEYYGSSLFLLATDVVTVYVFQEPSLLSSLQDGGLTDVVQEAILVKNIPPTREVIASIPNIFSALCLNTRGLNAFLKCKPFHKICKLLISPHYLPAMRRRRSAEPMGDTATNLGNAMDELMRHQPGLRAEATAAMIKLLGDLCEMSSAVRVSTWKEQPPRIETSLTTTRAGTSEVGSSEEDDDDEEPSISSQPQAAQGSGGGVRDAALETAIATLKGMKPPPPMVDYIFNAMKFLDAILSNNSTDDHCREFVNQQGIKPLMNVFSLPNLPLDFPNTASCQAVSAVCKSILTLAHESKVLEIGMTELDKALIKLEQLEDPLLLPHPGSSVLLHEIALAKWDQDRFGESPDDPSETPILASMTAVHSFVMMFIQVCRTGQPDVRAMSTEEWGGELGLKVLRKLSKLYLNLVWESTVLLAICSGEFSPEAGDFARADLDILVPPKCQTCQTRSEDSAGGKAGSSSADGMEVDHQCEVDMNAQATHVSSSTQTNTKSDKSTATLQGYAKILKPVLSASSRLGRALAELFGLLVKLAIGSPMRQRRGGPIQTGPVIVSHWADNIATVLSELLAQGLRREPIPTSPVPKLQLSICAVGFSSPLLFDEKRFPYHLMLKKFIDSEGLAALFEVFYWAMGPDSDGEKEETLTEQQVEFLDSWLVLVERFVNPTTVMETPHSIPGKNGMLPNRFPFNPSAFLGHVHKLAFKAILYVWKNKPIKLIGSRPADLMLLILCNIIRHKDATIKETEDNESSEAAGPSTRTRAPPRPTDTMVAFLELTRNRNTSRPPNQEENPERTTPSEQLNQRESGLTHQQHQQFLTELASDPYSMARFHPGLPYEDRRTLALFETRRRLGEFLQPPPRDEVNTEEDSTSVPPPQGTVLTNPFSEAEIIPIPAPEPTEAEPTQVPSEGVEGSSEPSATITLVDVSNANNTSTETPPAPESSSSSTTAAADTARALNLDPAHLQTLLDMGFPEAMCIEALQATRDLVQATDYLLGNSTGGGAQSSRGQRGAPGTPGPLSLQQIFSQLASTSVGPRTSRQPSLQTIRPGRTMLIPPPLVRHSNPHPIPPAERRRHPRPPRGDMPMDWDYQDDDIFRAIIMSMDDHDRENTVDEKNYESLTKDEINAFTSNVFEKCLELVDEVPESVFRVCELLVAVGSWKNPYWMQETMGTLMCHTQELAACVNDRIRTGNIEDLTPTSKDLQLCIRLHLLSLLFEEVKFKCYDAVELSGVVTLCIDLLNSLQRVMWTAATTDTELDTPKWAAPAILLLDLYEKAAVASKRKRLLLAETDHVWKWYDINSGKWCGYSSINNQNIDKAFLDGESSIRIMAGRRRYVIQFNGMVQLNEDTSNRRPITLWLKPPRKDHPSMLRVAQDIQTKLIQTQPTARLSGSPDRYILTYPVTYPTVPADPEDGIPNLAPPSMEVEPTKPIFRIVRKGLTMLHGFSPDESRTIIRCCVEFLTLPVEPDALHATMRLCLRLTRDYDNALYFSKSGGVLALLRLNSTTHFNGFLPLANLIIRHCMEDPECLKFAIEKMIREKVCTPCAATCKELHYLLRVLSPMACRAPKIFVDVAKEILRVDLPFLTRRGIMGEEDRRLIVKPLPSKTENIKIHNDSADCARDVIHKLLMALADRYDDDEEETTSKKTEATTAKSSRAGGQSGSTGNGSGSAQTPRGDLVDPFEQMDLDAPSTSSSSTQKAAKNELNEKYIKPLIPKCAILQLLAESVHSYTYSCKIIAEFSYQRGSCRNVHEDCTALGFLLDRLGPINQFLGNKDCNTILRDLLTAMSGCNHLPDAQGIVISEVKAALHRLLMQRESQEKHLKLQYLLNLIAYMIENCPSSVMTQFVAIKVPHVAFNHVVRLLVKKNVVNDLARVVHYVDLTSKYVAQTINATLKCLELISRVVNIPPQSQLQMKPKPRTGSQGQDSHNNTHTVATSNSEGTRAQGEETVEDAENTEHDISAAAESLVSFSEGITHTANADVEAFEEIMGQLLERENVHPDEALTDTQNSLMDTETTEGQRRNETYDADHEIIDSDSSISSEPSSEEEDDDDNGDHNGGGGGGGAGGGEDDDDDDDEDDDDDDEVDEEDALSNYDEPQDEERHLRAPQMERDDEMLMVQYGAGDDPGPIFFTNNTTYNFNLGLFEETLMSEQSNVGLRLNHPLLQPPSNETTVHGAVARGHRTGRQRRYQYFQYINPRHPPPPAILQRLLGPSTAQDVIQLTTGQTLNHQGIRDTRLLLMDASTDQNVNRVGATGSSGTLSNFTAFHWWVEEAKVLDGESMHDCIVGIKKEIVMAVEKDRDAAFELRREKRKQEETRILEQKASASQPKGDVSDDEEVVPPTPSATQPSSETTEPVVSGGDEAGSAPPPAAPPAEQPARTDILDPRPRAQLDPGWRESPSALVSTNELFRGGLMLSDEMLQEDLREIRGSTEGGSASAPPVPLDDEETVDWSEDMIPIRTSTPINIPEVFDPVERTTPELEAIAIEELTRRQEIQREAAEGEARNADNPDNFPPPLPEPIPGPSGVQNIFREILGDMEIPDGVDPSFLAALPEDMRQEVISEHLRIQRLREQTSQLIPPESSSVATATPMEVSPEFLAALPPNIQEEVLAQQRIEQQRRVATTANPNDPVDAEAFFRTLQPNLRQVILADMEESQMAAIPAEFHEEAQNLRRNWVTRNRQLLQERLFHNHTASTTLSSILRQSGMRLTGRFGLQGGIHRSQWPSGWIPRPPTLTAPTNVISAKAKGKQLVDFETLSCLMVILFLDDSKINTGRLHRVIRNLCYHSHTRAWIIKSLLSVLEKSDETHANPSTLCGQWPMVHQAGQPKEQEKKGTLTELVPTWLNISLDSALGCSANVFQIFKHTASTSKKLGSENRFISVHPQAITQIARHTIDALSNLAKSFPTHFLPHPAVESDEKILNTDTTVAATESAKKGPQPSTSSSSPGKAKSGPDAGVLLFWDFLLKLDGTSSGKRGKGFAKMGVHTGAPLVDTTNLNVTFEASPFGKLITMLGYRFIRRKQMLTDKLLRLLSLISLGIPENSFYGKKVLLMEPHMPVDESSLISESHLRLIVDVITSKSCTEEGLEDATALLLNLSYGPPTTRDKILELMTEGVQELGQVVCTHIVHVMKELHTMKFDTDKEEEPQPGTSTDPDNVGKSFKGQITNRFTNETVVITAAPKSKTTFELQLPSMSALTSKTSSQAFFLRLLKVIMNIRDMVRGAIKRYKQRAGGNVPDLIQPSANESPHTTRRRENLNRYMARQWGLAIGGGRPPRAGNPMSVDDLFMEVVLPPERSNPPVAGAARSNPFQPSIPYPPALTIERVPEHPQPVVEPSVPGTSTNKEENVSEMNIQEEIMVFDEAKLLPRLSMELQLEYLWKTLSEGLLALGQTPDHHAVLVLQPAVEAFFLVHTFVTDADEKKKNTRETREAQLAHLEEELPPVLVPQPPPAPTDAQNDTEMTDTQVASADSSVNADLPPDTKKFLSFAETHRNVLNHILRQSTTHLADGPFAVLVDHTRVLDFDIKRRYFRTELDRLDEGVRREDLAVHVRRQHVFEDSFRELHRKTAEEWKNRFYIVFEGEEGQDAGGLLREWYVIISREIFNPMYALFTVSPGDRVTYMINSSSHCNSNHLFYFKFVGRVIAKAVYDNKLLECYFTRSFYKHILGKYVKHGDMESEDYAFFQGLEFLMDNHISELGYDLTFSTEVQEFGVTEVRDLVPDGRNIPVTEENKMEYVRLVCQMKMTGAIRKQLNAFLEGFYDIIPKRLISIFNEQELELLVSGLPNVDIEDLKANTEYHKYQSTSLQIQWFWRALRAFDQADRAKFLQFVTGTSKVPLQGFGSLEGMNGVQKFQIHRDDRATDRLPSAHTCFNQLDLPAYETYDKLRTYMLKAIHECSEGFGFA